MNQNSILNSTISDNRSLTLPEPESLTPKENHTHCFWLIDNDDLKVNHLLSQTMNRATNVLS